MGMPRRRGQQIVGPHNLLHPLGGIVDHDHEVVGRCAVASPQDEIIDCLGMAPVTSIHDRDVGMLRSEPQRGGRPLASCSAIWAVLRSRQVPG